MLGGLRSVEGWEDLPAADDATAGGAVQAAHAHTGQVEHASLIFDLEWERQKYVFNRGGIQQGFGRRRRGHGW